MALGSNPKDSVGAKKVSVSKLPPVAILHGAHAMMDGAMKYGPYNWRDNAVVASIYVDALMRHAMAWFDGEEIAADSQVHHLGHAIACAAILLDAQETGNLVDDRPHDGKTAETMARLNEVIKKRAEAKGTITVTAGTTSRTINSGAAFGNVVTFVDPEC